MTTAWTDALGTSEIFLDFQERLARLAGSERPLLAVGERGTGKELAVQRLHYLSPRWDKPLITVLCPALSPTLLESELFGHEAGAFTGARGRHQGVFERADHGTLFLDEVADMPLPLQDKLLRVLEYGAFERVGGGATVRVDVRVIAATNRDLPALAASGAFRPDLLDRLAFDVLHVPPLRLREGDALLLARHFAAGMAADLGLTQEGTGEQMQGFGPSFGEQALWQLETYPWPGNVRELKNAVERTVARRRSVVLDRLDLDPFQPPYGQHAPPHDQRHASAHATDKARPPLGAAGQIAPEARLSLSNGFRLHDALESLERQSLAAALRQARYRQTEAARLLGLTYHQFRALYRKHGSWLNIQRADHFPDVS